MLRRTVSFFIYLTLTYLIITVIFPIPWFISPILTASPFYVNGYIINTVGGSYVPNDSLMIFSGFSVLIAIGLIFAGMSSRRKMYRAASKTLGRSMSIRFSIAIFFLLMAFFEFYYSLPLTFKIGGLSSIVFSTNANYGFYDESWVMGFLALLLFAGAFQRPLGVRTGAATQQAVAAQPVAPMTNIAQPAPNVAPPPQQPVRTAQQTRPQDGRNSVGLLGSVASGKSTMLAYLIHFLKNTTRSLNVSYDVVEGQQFYENFLNSILKNRQFPSATGVEAPNRIAIRFYTETVLRRKEVFFEVNDVAGELFSKESPSTQKRREAFMYLSSCFAYVFIVDCSTYVDWTSEDLRFTSILNDLYRSTGEKREVRSPIAFVFTKSDMLPDAVSDNSPTSLLESLPHTIGFVKSHFRDYSAFKTYIKTERDEEGNIVPSLDTLAGARVDIVYDPSMNYGFQQITEWICEKGDLT